MAIFDRERRRTVISALDRPESRDLMAFRADDVKWPRVPISSV